MTMKLLLSGVSSDAWRPGELVQLLKGQAGLTKAGTGKAFGATHLKSWHLDMSSGLRIYKLSGKEHGFKNTKYSRPS